MSISDYSVSVTFDKSEVESDIRITQEDVDRYINSCLRDSCKLIRDYARGNHEFNNKTGKLERAIRFRVIDKVKEGIVYVNLKEAPYGRYVQEDTGIFSGRGYYDIYPNRAKALRFFSKRYGRFIYAMHVKHPGSRGEDFLQRAFDANIDNVNKIFEDGLRRLINGWYL